MSAYLLAMVLAVGLGAWASTGATAGRRFGWGTAAVAFGVGAVGLGVRALEAGASAALLLVLTALLGYAAWQAGRSLRDAATVPHWTTAVAAASAGLLLEGHALTIVLDGWGWTYQALAIAGFALVGPTTLAWGVVGALWLRHRTHETPAAAPTRADAARAAQPARTRTVTN